MLFVVLHLFIGIQYLCLFQTRKSWSASILLSLSFIMLLCIRIMIMGDSTPSFSKADNPTARHPSFVTRTLTFLYLPLLNLKLLLFPQQLSYDWGMEAIQPIQNIYDLRNLLTISFHTILIYTSVRLGKFLLRENSQHSKMSKLLPGKMTKVCDNLEVKCNYCKYRGQNEEICHKHVKAAVDINNNEICNGIKLNLNFTNQAKSFEKLSNVDRKAWNPNCFQYESVIEIYVKKVCLALMSVYMYSAHKDYGDSPYKHRRSKLMANGLEAVHDKLYNNGDEVNLTEGMHDTVLVKETKIKLNSISNIQSTHEMNSKSVRKLMKPNPNKHLPSRVNLKSSQKNNKCTCSKTQPSLDTWKPKLKHEERLIIMLALLVIPCIPASNVFFYVGFVLAERVLYIPSVGYCYLVAYGYSWLQKRLWRKKMMINAAFVFLMLMYSLKTIRRNMDWRDEESLYRSGIAVNPPKCKWQSTVQIIACRFSRKSKSFLRAVLSEKESIVYTWLAFLPNLMITKTLALL